MIIRTSSISAALGMLLSLGAGRADAAEGRIEINHERALAGRVTNTDVAGYPVTLSGGGSFVLTGNLTPPIKTSGIEIVKGDTELDLNGFAIRGVFSCAAGACSPSAGFGIESPAGVVAPASVRNGFVEGFGSACVQVPPSSLVVGLIIRNCGEDGIDAGDRSLVRQNTIVAVGRHGIFFPTGIGGYADNSVDNSATDQPTGVAVSGGTAVGGNLCDDGRCSRRGTRRYYLTTATFNGAQALGACAAGFHLASAFELLDPSDLEYFTELGDVEADSGRGPISNNSGWVRSGQASSTTQNCAAWTSSSSAHTGFSLLLRPATTWNDAAVNISPWQASAARACNGTASVWCAED